MAVNIKKSLKLNNNTKYFNPQTSRARVEFASPYTYQSRQIKIEGYEARLYWQYRYCDEHDGQTFFYTLTYNDKAMPTYEGVNCFDYEDLRDLLTGGFRKKLLRKYGTTFKYFIGAELGDGKGERGMHNNPHYHVLFFLEPDKDSKFPYVKISPEDFRHLVRQYWQGFDEDTDGFHDYNDAKYGIAREGENLGLVTDFRACQYCAKYVTKDVNLIKAEKHIEQESRLRHKSYRRSYESYRDFYHTVMEPIYNPKGDNSWDHWFRNHLPKNFFEFSDEIGFEPSEEFDLPLCVECILFHSPSTSQTDALVSLYYDFCTEVIDDRVREEVNLYRNRYCNKCRISQGVGEYALEYIDKDDPLIQVPSKKGFKNRPLPLYYFRKIYTKVINTDEVMPDGSIEKHSPIRVLNDDGIQYKLSRLEKQINRLSEKTYNTVSSIIGDDKLHLKMAVSDVNTGYYGIELHHDDNGDPYYTLNSDIATDLTDNNKLKQICRSYAEFKLVYEDRFFKVWYTRDGSLIKFPTIDLLYDYERFITPAFYSSPRSDIMLDKFLQSDCKGYLSYREHPYFLQHSCYFGLLDMCSDYWFVKDDDKNQKEAEDIAAVRRFHSREKLKDFYSNFVNF